VFASAVAQAPSLLVVDDAEMFRERQTVREELDELPEDDRVAVLFATREDHHVRDPDSKRLFPIEVALADEKGRLAILRIHVRRCQ